MLGESAQTHNTCKCILPNAVSRIFHSFAKTNSNASNDHSTLKKIRLTSHLQHQTFPISSTRVDANEIIDADSESGDGKVRGEGKDKGDIARSKEGNPARWASMGLAVEAGDGDVGCSSDPSDEGFVALVQGDLSNTNSISESGGVDSDVGDGLDSEERKNRDRYFDWVVRGCELQIPRS